MKKLVSALILGLATSVAFAAVTQSSSEIAPELKDIHGIIKTVSDKSAPGRDGWEAGYSFHLNQAMEVNAVGVWAANGPGSDGSVTIWDAASGEVVFSVLMVGDQTFLPQLKFDGQIYGYSYSSLEQNAILPSGNYIIGRSASPIHHHASYSYSDSNRPSAAQYLDPNVTITGSYFRQQTLPSSSYGTIAAPTNFSYWGIGNNAGEFILPVTFSGVVVSVPEPETYAMLLLGLGMIGVMRKRRQD
jgi:hypothetical protein